MEKLISYNNNYSDYLSDESRTEGKCDYISFPENEEDIKDIISALSKINLPVTVQGGMTGITGGAVPQKGAVLNLSKMNKMGSVTEKDSCATLTCEPGVLLSEIRNKIKNSGYFFPNDPTETSASIGGMAACNASGALSYEYKSIRPWISGLKIILSDGDTLTLNRGEHFAQNFNFSLTTDQGNEISGTLPNIHYVDIKSAAGYYIRPNMDLIDLFIGMEGTFGIISSITIKLIPKRKSVTGIVVFFPNEESALTFVRNIRGENEFPNIGASAIEFFSGNALDLVNRMKTERDMFSELNTIKEEYRSAVYIEFQKNTEDETDKAIENLYEILENMEISDEDTWCASDEKELAVLKLFRHAIPESVNTLIGEIKRTDPNITKLSTDMSVPNAYLEFVFDLYNSSLKKAGLDYVIFGHIGNNHLHVNIIPNSEEEYRKGKELYREWAKKIVSVGGSVSAEHGIGKIKKDFFNIMFSQKEIEEMKNLKKLFDKNNILNIGNIFD
ncbi:MAG: FAD-binding oxidoreductase [Armatimonadetes bacterium]|nr:FAD-binding oxidoreductase [Candidatus Hippobium faecium]